MRLTIDRFYYRMKYQREQRLRHHDEMGDVDRFDRLEIHISKQHPVLIWCHAMNDHEEHRLVN